jgi:hypothetical protein
VRGKGGTYRDGDDGDFPSPLDFVPPITPLDWALFCVKDVCLVVGVLCEGLEDQIVALLTAIGEDHSREENEAYSKSRGKRELLNLEFSIIMVLQARRLSVGKARLLFVSGKRFVGFGF